MQSIAKTLNRADSIWTMVLMAPVLLMLLGVGLNVTQGKASPSDFGNSAGVAAEKFIGQYAPYTEATGSVIAAASNGLFKIAVNKTRHSGAGHPIYFSKTSHSYGKNSTSMGHIKPYSHYSYKR